MTVPPEQEQPKCRMQVACLIGIPWAPWKAPEKGLSVQWIQVSKEGQEALGSTCELSSCKLSYALLNSTENRPLESQGRAQDTTQPHCTFSRFEFHLPGTGLTASHTQQAASDYLLTEYACTLPIKKVWNYISALAQSKANSDQKVSSLGKSHIIG